ncbi:hypothetical protein QWY99_18535 [Flavobacterium branchiarum]|uniref:Uncharacterized protein n=1 Tax=Flavobacterium branchiarum TaxID=1114870 RepID=A0ABV5FJ03_9FLAO|nr:hypothetical protein [Flavobacterium branchiarum]MDN3675036.1 hypothetical protein [Flavobacterium branchiarum]
MKKKLEADLISIAHRILKIKNKSDINQLYLETQKLYEKLAVLKFIDENFEETKPTIGRGQIDATIETAFEKEEVIQPEKAIVIEEPIAEEEVIVNEVPETPIEETPEPIVTEVIESKTGEIIAATVLEIPEPIQETLEPIENEVIESKTEEIISEIAEETHETIQEISEPIVNEEIENKPEEIIEEIVEETSEKNIFDEPIREEKVAEVVAEAPIVNFTPSFDFTPDTKEETPEKSDVVHISFEDLMGIDYSNAQFVKVDSFEAVPSAPTPPAPTEFKEKKKEVVTATTAVLEESKPVSLNEKLSKGFHIDLNDRIAFTKHLFGNSPEDYNRVLNQLITFDSFDEANDFLESMVKPDYNNWDGKDEYAQRFTDIIEKKFS